MYKQQYLNPPNIEKFLHEKYNILFNEKYKNLTFNKTHKIKNLDCFCCNNKSIYVCVSSFFCIQEEIIWHEYKIKQNILLCSSCYEKLNEYKFSKSNYGGCLETCVLCFTSDFTNQYYYNIDHNYVCNDCILKNNYDLNCDKNILDNFDSDWNMRCLTKNFDY